ncbi:unnamed protein product [Sphagnum balticum]
MAEACEQLRKELSATESAKLRSHTLDITDAKTCAALAQFLKKEHGGLDVLVNNAGIAFKNDDSTPFPEQARVTNMTNYFGLHNICDALFPLLRANGRVVNVQSQAGVMKTGYSDEHVKLMKSPTLTIAQIDAFVNKFIEHAAVGDHVAAGYRNSAYCVSKAAGIALSAVQQRAFDGDKARSGILVNACCPGYVDTDMTSHKGPLTVDQGADTPVWLATLPSDATSPAGQFCFERAVFEW